jgi:hypothetical protein
MRQRPANSAAWPMMDLRYSVYMSRICRRSYEVRIQQVNDSRIPPLPLCFSITLFGAKFYYYCGRMELRHVMEAVLQNIII